MYVWRNLLGFFVCIMCKNGESMYVHILIEGEGAYKVHRVLGGGGRSPLCMSVRLLFPVPFCILYAFMYVISMYSKVVNCL